MTPTVRECCADCNGPLTDTDMIYFTILCLAFLLFLAWLVEGSKG